MYGLSDNAGELGAAVAALLPFLPGLDIAQVRAALSNWVEVTGGTARITGSRARNLNPILAGDAIRVIPAWWWLHRGGKPLPYSAFNSRDDALLDTWRPYLAQRALVPATWFVEKKTRIAVPDNRLFLIAALAHHSHHLTSYSLVTTEAVGATRDVHTRMPLVINPNDAAAWIDPERRCDAALIDQLVSGSTELRAAMIPHDSQKGSPCL